MPIIINNSLGLQVDPASTADFRNELTEEVQAGLQEGIPGLQFAGVPNVQPQADEPVVDPATPAEPQWQTLTFEPTEAPPPPAPIPEEQGEERGFLHNLTRKLGNRAGQLLSDMTFNVADTAGDFAPDWMNSGIVFDETGVHLAKGDDYDKKSFVANVADVLRDNQYKIVDYKDTRTFEDIKKSWNDGDKSKLAGDVAIYALENGVASIPDMVGIMLAAPSYFAGLASSYTQQRVDNDEREKPTPKDLAYGTATALVVSALERYGAENVLGMLGDGSKSAVRKFFEGIAAETFTEAVQNPVEFVGQNLDTKTAGQVTLGNLAEQSIGGALGGLGGAAVVGGTVHGAQALAGRDQTTAGAPTQGVTPTAPAAAATSPPAQTTPTPPAGASPPAGPAAGGVTLYQPEGAQGPTPVRVESINGEHATVTSLDADGNPLIVDGEPATYVVSTTDLGAPKTTAKPEAAPQVQPGIVVTKLQPPTAGTISLEVPDGTKGPEVTTATVDVPLKGPANPQGVPDVPSAEPLKDIVAQLADMKNPENSRQGVFLSHDNVKNLNGLKLLGRAKEMAVPVVNFDFAGGLMLFPDKATADAALEQRKQIQQMKSGKRQALQALIGTITGAGVAKPSDPNAVVVQQLTPEGAVTRESLVAPELAQASSKALAADGRTVQVVTPEQAQVRRAEGVAADNAQRATGEATEAVVTPPATKTEQAQPVTTPASSKKPTSALGGLRGAMAFITEQEKVPAGKKLARKLEERQQNAAMFAQALKAAAAEAAKKGAPDDVVAAANEAVRSVSALADKSEYETRKGQGTGHAKITSKVAGLLKAAEGLAKHYDEKVKPEEEKMAAYVAGKKKQQEPVKDQGDASKPDEPAVPGFSVRTQKASKKIVYTPTAKAKSYVAEETAPTKEAQNIQPRPVEGAELKALFKDVGWDPHEIIEAAEKSGGSKRAGRGALARELARFLPEMNKPGSWLQYLAALKTSDALSFSERQRLFKAIESFAKAEDRSVKALTEAVNVLEKGPLEQKAVDAILEYANFRRAFEQLREDMEQIEAGEIVDDSDQELESPTGYIDEFDDGRLSSVRVDEEGDHFSIKARARQKWSWRNAGEAAKPLFSKLTGGAYGSRQVINNLIFRLRDQPGVEYFRAVLTRLKDVAPDVSIRITDTFPEEHLIGSRGLFDPRDGAIHIKASMSGSEQLQVLIHELVHAATYYELSGGPDHKLGDEIERIRLRVLEGVSQALGGPRVARTMAAYAGDPVPDDFVSGLYGLTSNVEFVAEVMSNPDFHVHLAGVGQRQAEGTQAGYQKFLGKLRALINKVFDEILDWLGFSSGPESELLRRALGATDELMQAQMRRGQEAAAKIDAAIKKFNAETGSNFDAGALMLLDGPASSSMKLGAMYRFDAKERTRLEREAQEAVGILSSVRDPRPLRNELNIRALVGDVATDTARRTRDFGKGQVAEKIRKGYLSMYTFDQIERRMSRFFGSMGADNALTRLMDVRRKRQSHANTVLERAEKDVNAKWLKLNKAQNKQLGQMMIDSTLWQIDPSKPPAQQVAKVAKRRDFKTRYDKLKQQWQALNKDQREIFESARNFNEFLFNKVRRAAVDLALDGLTDQELAPALRSLLYAARSADDIDTIVGSDRPIDIPTMNEQLAAALKDVMRLTKIEGPYFTLRRHGDKVVEAKREGDEEFATKKEADARAEQIKSMTPKNKAVVHGSENKYLVRYKMHYVAFHKSRKDAEVDAGNLRQAGFHVGAITEKTTSTASPALTPALKELLSSAQRKLGGEGEGRAAIGFALENAFTQILAERAASIASELKRQGFAGVKPEEMHMGFAERSHSTAWHYANMVTAKDEVRALTTLRHYARDPELGTADQATMYQRGLVVNEVEKRIGIEAQDFGQAGPVDSFLGKIGFAGYLMTPSYAFVNAMQNFTVAMPVVGAKYGYGRTSKAFARAMGAVAGPAFSKAFRGMAKRPGQITSYDIYQAIAESLKDHPRFAKWVQGDNSAIKQLVDLGVINASFTQELVSVAEGESRPVRKAFEYARLLPQGAEMFNRISTALAALELTKGDVTKTADLVRLTQIDYAVQNQPRSFRRIGRFNLPRSITMFKMYPQAIYNLLVGSVYDSITGAGASRGEASKTLAGLLLTHTVAAGVIGGLLLEPLRWLIGAWNWLFGDEDKPYDLDTATRLFLADTFGDTMGDVVARGVFTSVGIDLSTRLGLNHLAFYSPPDLTRADEAAWYKMIAEALGPIPSLLARSHTSFMKAWDQGRYRDALASAIPIKLLQDTNKAWNLVNDGVTTGSGVPITEPLSTAQGVARALGFRTAEEAKVADKQSTKFNYEDWSKARKSELFNAYWNATTPAEKTSAIADIKEFNSKNPGGKISKGDLIKSRRAAKQQAAQVRGEKIRNKDLRERMDY